MSKKKKCTYIGIKKYEEKSITDNGIKEYELILKNENNLITGYRKDNTTDKSRLVIGKKLNNNIFELIEFNETVDISKVYYGHIEENRIYGTWKKYDKQDLLNLTTSCIKIPKFISSMEEKNATSLLKIKSSYEKETIFNLNHQRQLNLLSNTNTKIYQKIKKVD